MLNAEYIEETQKVRRELEHTKSKLKRFEDALKVIANGTPINGMDFGELDMMRTAQIALQDHEDEWVYTNANDFELVTK